MKTLKPKDNMNWMRKGRTGQDCFYSPSCVAFTYATCNSPCCQQQTNPAHCLATTSLTHIRWCWAKSRRSAFFAKAEGLLLQSKTKMLFLWDPVQQGRRASRSHKKILFKVLIKYMKLWFCHPEPCGKRVWGLNISFKNLSPRKWDQIQDFAGETNVRIPAGCDSTRIWLLDRMQQGRLVHFPGSWKCLPLPHTEEACWSLCWGKLIALSGFGDIWTAFVHASAGSWISFGILPMIAGLSPLMSQTNILDFHNSSSHLGKPTPFHV